MLFIIYFSFTFVQREDSVLTLYELVSDVRYMIGLTDEIKNVKFDSGPAAEIAVHLCSLAYLLNTHH